MTICDTCRYRRHCFDSHRGLRCRTYKKDESKKEKSNDRNEVKK